MTIRDFPGCRPVHARLAIRDDSKTEANERSIRRESGRNRKTEWKRRNPRNRMIPTVSGVPIRAENTRFCAECEKSLIFRQFSRLQGDDATVIPTVYTVQHAPSSSATVNSTIIPIVVCMTLKQLPMARSALQEGRLSCQQRSLLGIWNLSP